MPMSEAAYWALVKSDLKHFIRHAFTAQHSNSVFMDNWHIDAIAYQLQLAIQGKCRRQIINLPPRHLKSYIVSIALPAFLLGHDPTVKVICVSYSDGLAKDFTEDFRRIVESEWYRRLFPNVRLVKNTEHECVTDQGGGRYATSVGGSLTGRGGDFILMDDPSKGNDIHSAAALNKVNNWFRDTVQTRLDDPERGVMILAMQRLHVNDLSGYVYALGGFHKLSLPAIATEEQRIPIGHGRHHFRFVGDLLHEERMGYETLQDFKNTMGPDFNAQFQQDPDSPVGAIFKKQWLNIVDEFPEHRYGLWTISVDTALTLHETSDYTAITVMYSDESGHYVYYADRGRWDYPELVARVMSIERVLGRDFCFIVEAAGNGYALAMALRNSGRKCFHYHPTFDKVARAYVCVPLVASGRLHFVQRDDPRKNVWIKGYLEELMLFPQARHDDQVDSLIQVLPWAEMRVNPSGNYIGMHVADYYREVL